MAQKSGTNPSNAPAAAPFKAFAKHSSDAQSKKSARERWAEEFASFTGFFIYLLVLKAFFLPLFVIPTGSMAETLYGAHAKVTCPNCGVEYALGWQPPHNWNPRRDGPFHPPAFQCPNCRWAQFYGNPGVLRSRGVHAEEILESPLTPTFGDRIFVHGWVYDAPFSAIAGVGPTPWDVVVFKVPTDGQQNYIKRLIGLPNESIEIIDGDIFANDRIRRKTDDAQRSLWLPYYRHDFPPRKPTDRYDYYPRWAARGEGGAWTDLQTRAPRFDGREAPRAEIQFVTQTGRADAPGLIQDIYGYNGGYILLPKLHPNTVTDVRVSAEIAMAGGDGYVELITSKYDDRFFARLYADGRITLERENRGRPDAGREALCPPTTVRLAAPVHVALGVADYRARVELNGRIVLESSDATYGVSAGEARARARLDSKPTPEVRIAAEHVSATLRHLTIDRDVYYTNPQFLSNGAPGRAALDHPFQIGPAEYFVMGDNSPSSLDARLWESVGAHLEELGRDGRYTYGTVPADQLLGRAFFVYFPGLLPIERAEWLLTRFRIIGIPDVGRMRWIH